MISLYDILEAANGQLFGEPAAQIFSDLCLDPASVPANSLFVALKTDYGDTHRAIEQAIADGATGVLCSSPPDYNTTGVSVILVRDTVDALMAWARHVLSRSSVRVIAVAGSSGKSSTIEAIRHVMSSRFSVHTDSQQRDNRLSLPATLASLKPSHDFLLLRMGTTQPGELGAMVRAAQPEVGVVTAVHSAHLDRFENIDLIAQEQRALIEQIAPDGLGVLNYDDDRVRALASAARCKIATVSVDSFGATMMAYNVVVGPDGTGFDLRYGSERHVARWMRLLGKHQLYGLLTALSIGVHYGIPLDDAFRTLPELAPLPGRMFTHVGLNDCILVDDTHSANPESTLAALDWLAAVKDTRQRAIVVFGDMDGLGTHSIIGHRLVGQRAAEVAGLLVTEGAEAAVAGRAALDSGMDARDVRMNYSVEDTLSTLTTHFQLTPDDIVLVKGGPSIRMSRVVRALLKDPADADKLEADNAPGQITSRFQPLRPTWVEIDTEALAGNVRAIKQQIGAGVELMAVVKADAYGHGAVVTAQTALLNGAAYLAVANMAEALDLRSTGIEAPILILSYTPVYAVRQAIRQNLTVTLYDLDMARAYDRAAREIGGRLRVHVKLDTGMGRLGILPDDAIGIFRQLTAMTSLEIEGLYTHFSSAEEDAEYTARQVETLRGVLRPLRAGGINFRYIHAANTPGMLANKDNHFNMVRVGLALHGLHPSEKARLSEAYRPVMTWKTVIAQVKTLPPGHFVGYGNTYRTRGPERIAVLPIGYADGFRRWPNWGEVLVHGQRAPIVGRVSMEKSTINVSHIPGVAIGDEVVLIGKQGDDQITAEEIALRLGTINYEVVCSVLARVPRR